MPGPQCLRRKASRGVSLRQGSRSGGCVLRVVPGTDAHTKEVTGEPVSMKSWAGGFKLHRPIVFPENCVSRSNRLGTGNARG